MPNDQNVKVTAHQKNDDNKWYYAISVAGEAGSRVGPYDSEEEALEAGEQALADKEDDATA